MYFCAPFGERTCRGVPPALEYTLCAGRDTYEGCVVSSLTRYLPGHAQDGLEIQAGVVSVCVLP